VHAPAPPNHQGAQKPIAHPQKKRVSGFDVVAGALGSVYQPYKSEAVRDVE